MSTLSMNRPTKATVAMPLKEILMLLLHTFYDMKVFSQLIHEIRVPLIHFKMLIMNRRLLFLFSATCNDLPYVPCILFCYFDTDTACVDKTSDVHPIGDRHL